jgi:hypothetical protein
MRKSLGTLLTVCFCQFALNAVETPKKEIIMAQIVATYDVCNVDRLYDKDQGFEFSLPRKILEEYLSGKAFDNPEFYTEVEARQLRQDISTIFEKIIAANPLKEKIAVITAGAPGAGKTYKMRQDLQGKKSAYIDPDDVCLKDGMKETYLADIAKGDQSKEVRFAAYNKWRPGSNAACQLILGNLIRDGLAFHYGTTATGAQTGRFFAFLKAHGYQIRVIHVTAPDDVRWTSIQERDKTFVQTTEQDTKVKGDLLPQRINDTYLAFADEIEFCYRGSVKEEAILAAKWTRNREGGKGLLEVLDPKRYDMIKTIHDTVAERLGRSDLNWKTAVEERSEVR